MTLKEQMLELATQAKKASRDLRLLNTALKNEALISMANALLHFREEIKKANALDLESGTANGLSAAMLDRLKLNDQRIEAMAKGLREVAALPDPVGRKLSEWERPNGLKIQKISVPLGVICIIYESRPNVTADAAALCFKSGNAVILRGGKEAIHSNKAIVKALREGMLRKNVSPDCIVFVETTDRDAIRELLQLTELIDLAMPRGGEGLIRAVAEVSRVPVIKHYKGVCHVYVESDADADLAEKLVINAKCQRPGVCNAMETLLLHESIVPTIGKRILESLQKNKVELRADEDTRRRCGLSDIKPAFEADWLAEYLDLILAVRSVRNIEEAMEHIARYGSAHSDCIVTENEALARRFLNEVDSATVYHNASTRFTDGGEFGFGAEIGISTDKLHARGPMGLDELTTYKYIIQGNGQVRT